jgi:ribosomal protein L11 methyltransferase
MEWVQIAVEVEAETAEAVAEVLSRYAHGGVVIEAGPEGCDSGSVAVMAYVPQDDRASATEQAIREALWHLGQIRPVPDPVFTPIADTDWTLAWREKLNVLHIGQHIVVRPSWRAYEPRDRDVVIDLDPGQAFGTGLHPSTQLCLGALEELVWPGSRVLDLGTGSGILAIAAAKLGAAGVQAIDLDPVAVVAARANVAANQVSATVSVLEGSLAEATGSYDVVVVNILLRTILQLLESDLAAYAKPGGHIVLAGLLVEQEVQVVRSATAAGLTPARRWISGDWIGLALTKTT